DRDVPAGGLRVRAQLVRTVDDLLRLVLVDAGDAHGELDAQAEALALLADPHLCVDDGLRRVDAQLLAGQAQGTLEAGAVAHGEELLRVGALTGSAHLLGRLECDLELPVVGGAAAVATAGDLCACGVGDGFRSVHRVLLLVTQGSRPSGPSAEPLTLDPF